MCGKIYFTRLYDVLRFLTIIPRPGRLCAAVRRPRASPYTVCFFVYFILYHNGLHVCKFFIKNIVLIVQMIILMYTDSGILCIIYKKMI